MSEHVHDGGADAAPEITCAEAVEIVTDYLDGALDEVTLERFEQHLALCRGCDTYLEQIRRTAASAARLRDDDLDPSFRDDLLRAFQGWQDAR